MIRQDDSGSSMPFRSQSAPFSLLTAVRTLQHKADPDGLYVEDILATFGSRSHAFLILFFSIPFIQPIPLFGLSTPLGMIVMTLGFFLALDRRPWLPQKLLRKHIQSKLIVGICKGIIRVLEKTEKLIKPRLGILINATSTRILNGVLTFIFALLLALPLPVPFSNSIPAYFLILNAIGWLEGDGLLVVISYLVAIVGFVFFFSLGFGAVEIFEWFRLKI